MKYSLNILLCILSSHAFSQFKDIALDSSVIHTHISPDLQGGGVGVIDINNDGWEDLYFTGGLSYDKLFINQGNGSFKDISYESGVYYWTRSENTTSVSIGDVNNDSFEDIFITTQFSSSLLLINNGDNTFLDVTVKSNINNFSAWGMGSVMFDANHDGLIDIYQINYIEEFHTLFDSTNTIYGFDHICSSNYLFINKGNNVFQEMSNDMGLDGSGCSLAVTPVDINQDGFLDLLVANDFGAWIAPNEAFVYNVNLGIYEESAVKFNLNDSIYGMGIAVGDINNDLKNEIYITNIGSNVFRIQDSTGIFQNQADNYNINDPTQNEYNSTGWGTVFTDYDNDGYQDLYVANGFVNTASFLNTTKVNPNRLYKNVFGETFIDVSSELNLPLNKFSRGVVQADLNNDGFMDLVLNNVEVARYTSQSNVNLLINQSQSNGNNWIGFSINPQHLNRAVGTEITIYYESKIQSNSILNTNSHASSPTKRVIFGLENHSTIDSIRVNWSNHKTQLIKNTIALNEYYQLSFDDDNPVLLDCDSNTNWGCNIKEKLALDIQTTFNSTIYPNPSNGIINIESLKEIEHIRLFDISGREMHQTTDYQKSQHQTTRVILQSITSSMCYILLNYTDGTSEIQRIYIRK